MVRTTHYMIQAHYMIQLHYTIQLHYIMTQLHDVTRLHNMVRKATLYNTASSSFKHHPVQILHPSLKIRYDLPMENFKSLQDSKHTGLINKRLGLFFHPFLIIIFHIIFMFTSRVVSFSYRRLLTRKKYSYI